MVGKQHIPVLLAEVLQQLNCRRSSTIVDCTLGGAGHAGAILDLIAPDGVLVGIELDDEAINVARIALQHFSQQTKFVKGNFKHIDHIFENLGISSIDGFLFDLGLSSFQLDNFKRGFSYKHDGPLDMRIDKGIRLTACEVINSYSKKKLAAIIRRYGEERWSERIASFIVKAREREPITTTLELVEVIKDAIPASARRGRHPAKRTFQAIRIEVNRELEAFEKSLRDIIKWLNIGGRGVVISYHSLEDRIAKNVFREFATGCVCPKDLPVCRCGRQPQVKILTKKPITPTKGEIVKNPRARSAKLRAIEKIN